MASLFHTPAFRTARRRSTAELAARDGISPCSMSSTLISAAQLWRESLQTFSAQAGVILLCALLSLSSLHLIGHWIATQAVLHDAAWTDPVLRMNVTSSSTLLIMLAGMVWCASSFTRGLITRLALQDTAGAAIRNTLRCLPALLAGNLVYSALASLFLLGLSLTMVGLDTAWAAHRNILTTMSPKQMVSTASEQLQQEGMRAFISHTATAPFASLLLKARAALFRSPSSNGFDTWLDDAVQRGHIPMGSENMLAAFEKQEPEPQSLVEQWQAKFPLAWRLFSPFCAMMLIIAESLLRFRTVMAFKPLETFEASTMKSGGESLRRFAALSPLIDSARMGLRYFGVITLHIWLLRLAGAALMLLFVTLPMAVSTQVMVPALISLSGKTPLLPAWHFVLSNLAAFVAALVIAFSTVYDARLFAALQSDVE
jgi:hypothetical protein